ncbi:ATP-binding protein [Pelomonas sp. KK5]|uniref:ATP-binding protein n=1 Tax=Pelomonas sp. KK5 TaxID=1855730 RepID=UPI00097BDC9E|nr:ATP-binding protein [Pelomonas sp. KK5]
MPAPATFDVVDQLASARQRRVVLLLCLLVVLSALLALPSAGVRLVEMPHVSGLYGVCAAVIDLATFWLLGSAQRPSGPQRIIAAAYLYGGLMGLLHALSFPGALLAQGSVFGNGNTVSWLFVAWRAGFPVFVLWAVCVELRGRKAVRIAPAAVAWLAAAAALAMALAASGVSALVATPQGARFNPVNDLGSQLGALVAAVAVVLIWRGGLVRRSLYLWLVLVLVAEAAGVLLSSLGGGRYTLAWYGARVEGLMANAVVMVLLALHVRELQRQLAASVEALHAEMQHRERAERALAQAQKLEAVGQLAAGLAHDINNFMQVVAARSEIIRRRAGELVEADVAVVRRSLRRAEQLTRQLLLVAGRRQLLPQRVQLQRSVPEFVEAFQPVLGAQVLVRLEIDPDTAPVHVDPTELEVALANLLTNARDAQEGGAGEVRLAICNAGERVLLEVSDQGGGIPAAALERVFEPFFTMKAPGKGTGLGLAQVHAFVRGSGGEVEIRSELGQGTTVRMALPRATARQAEDGGAAGRPAPRPGELVLLVDDNRDVLESTSLLLTQAGFVVRALDDASQALALLDEGLRPDIVFSDIVVPGGLDGLQLARQVRRRLPQARVLLASGYSAAASEARSEGFTVLQKPYEAAAMLRALSS